MEFDLLLARVIAIAAGSASVRFRLAPENYYACEIDTGVMTHLALSKTLFGALSAAAERAGVK